LGERASCAGADASFQTREDQRVPKILVVDDDDAVRRMVEDVLLLDGYEVRTAEDGFAGLRWVESFQPDCVILDVMMPGMDGHAVLQRIRSRAGSHLPVVMLTAAADDSQAWRAWTEGVDYFLSKPFEPDELLRFLDHLFAGQLSVETPAAG
jgi:DNA-binding response OmpR family regulator